MSDFIKLPKIKALDNQLKCNNFLSSNPGYIYCCLAPVRQGKSTLIWNILGLKPKKNERSFSFYGVYDRLIVFSPSIDEKKTKDMLEKPFLKPLPGKKRGRVPDPGLFFKKYDKDEFAVVVDHIEATKDQHTLIIIDDCLPSFRKDKRFENMITRLGHLNCNLIMTCHSFTSVAPIVRQQVANWFLFPMASQQVYKMYCEIPTPFSNYKDFFAACQHAWSIRYNPLLVKVKERKVWSWQDSLCLSDLVSPA